MEPRRHYPTDLSDREWDVIKHLVPEAKPGGRPAKYPKREILNGILYILRSGCAWRLLPHDFPPWQMVYHYFWRWRQDGTWQRMHDLLRGAVMSEWRPASGASLALASLIANRSKPPKKGGPRLRQAQERQRPQTAHRR